MQQHPLEEQKENKQIKEEVLLPMEEVKGVAVEEVKVAEIATGPVKKKKNAKKAKGKVPIDQVVEMFLKSSKCISEEEAKKKPFLIEALKEE